jgi:hypothetical protein
VILPGRGENFEASGKEMKDKCSEE